MRILPLLVFVPFALYPAVLPFHLVVFRTKSNILLYARCHPSPRAGDSPCTCAFAWVCV